MSAQTNNQAPKLIEWRPGPAVWVSRPNQYPNRKGQPIKLNNPKTRLAFIEAYVDFGTIRKACEVAGVSTVTYNKHVKRDPHLETEMNMALRARCQAMEKKLHNLASRVDLDPKDELAAIKEYFNRIDPAINRLEAKSQVNINIVGNVFGDRSEDEIKAIEAKILIDDKQPTDRDD